MFNEKQEVPFPIFLNKKIVGLLLGDIVFDNSFFLISARRHQHFVEEHVQLFLVGSCFIPTLFKMLKTKHCNIILLDDDVHRIFYPFEQPGRIQVTCIAKMRF